MKFSQNGFDFTDEENPALLLNDYCKRKNVNAHAFLAIKGEYKTIVLYNSEGIPIFESQKTEHIATHIDMMAIAKDKGEINDDN